jgi:hypothetical protein
VTAVVVEDRRVSQLPPDHELPDELRALRALAQEATGGRRSEQATRSASVYLAERRRRLRRELASGVPARRSDADGTEA